METLNGCKRFVSEFWASLKKVTRGNEIDRTCLNMLEMQENQRKYG